MNDPTEGVPTKLKTVAVRAIAKFETAYYSDEGISSIEQELDKKREGLATHIYRVARTARKEASDLEETMTLFKAACGVAESKYKEQHEVINIAKRLPAWAQFKSRILRAMKHGLDPQNFGSERMLREAMRYKLQTAPPGRQPGKSNWLVDAGVHRSLHPAMTKLVQEVGLIPAAKRQAAKDIIQKASKALLELVDKRRVTDGAKDKTTLARAA